MGNTIIAAYGTQSIANADIQRLVRQEMARQNAVRDAEAAAREAALEKRVAELEERLMMKSRRVDELCAQLITALPDAYPDPDPGTRLGNALWGLVGLALLAFDRLNARAVARWYP